MSDLIGQSLGRYHILEQLGEGGMAVVYKAYDTRLETDVAVKVIRVENLTLGTMERALKRFEREAKALAKLNHPNIVNVTDYGEYEGKPYLVMPYFPGGTLKQKLGKPIPWQEAIQTLLPIAEALDYAHSQKMVHRDVKPANILLTERGQPMLTDFGIAKVLDVEETMDLTGTSAAVGTPEYMAPEQATAKIADHRADIYALGIVLYEMITGRKPYSADTPMAVLIMHARDPLPRPSKFVSGIPNAVEKVLIKALAKSPDDRYQNMAEMVIALEGLFGGKGKETRRVSKPKKIDKKPKTEKASIQRNWNIQKIIIVVALAGLVLAGAYGVPALLNKQEDVIEPSSTFTASPSETSAPTLTPTRTSAPTLAATKTAVLTATPFPEEISDIDPAGNTIPMRLVPAGEFTMGSEDSGEDGIYEIFLDTFYIDKYEVTTTLYKACVDASICSLPKDSEYYNDPYYSEHPIVFVNWNMARDYCVWRDAVLPTESQWEKSARGTDGRRYPWGSIISGNRANFCDKNCYNDWANERFDDGYMRTAPVGSYKNGQSPYYVYDMAGNVWEWVKEGFLRGGSWYYTGESLRSDKRGLSMGVAGSDNTIGFRCARDATP